MQPTQAGERAAHIPPLAPEHSGHTPCARPFKFEARYPVTAMRVPGEPSSVPSYPTTHTS